MTELRTEACRLTMSHVHHQASNVVSLRDCDTPTVRPRADVTARIAALLHDAEAFMTTFRMAPSGLEPALDQGDGGNAEPDVAGFMTKLKACHRKAQLYVVESTGPRVWNTVEPGEHLLVAPSCRLRTLGTCLVAFADGRPADIRIFIGRRDAPTGPVWILTSGNTEPASIEPSASLLALHPVVGSLLPAMAYDRQWQWTSRILDFLVASDSREKPIHPKWRPA